MSPIVTIDGPAGTGKSTIAKRLAIALHLPYLDTGAMYRWIAWYAIQNQLDLQSESILVQIADKSNFRFPIVNGGFQFEVSYEGSAFKLMGPEIRSPEVSMATSDVSRFPALRKVLVQKQQEIGSQSGAVCEGRDAGTVIFPHAPVKFFMTARPEIRATRRHQELLAKTASSAPSYEEVLKDVLQRDRQDSGRSESPMRPAEDAQIIDTSDLSEDEVFELLMQQVQLKKSALV